MAEDKADMNSSSKRGWCLSPTGRARGLLVALAERRGQGPPPSVGRGQGVPQLGRRQGLVSPHVGRGRTRVRALLLETLDNNTPSIGRAQVGP